MSNESEVTRLDHIANPENYQRVVEDYRDYTIEHEVSARDSEYSREINMPEHTVVFRDPAPEPRESTREFPNIEPTPRPNQGPSAPVQTPPSPTAPSLLRKKGINVSDAVIGRLIPVAKWFQSKTGKQLVISRGVSSPEEQAAAMLNNIIAAASKGDPWDELKQYANKDLAREILAAYNNTVGQGEAAIAREIAKVIGSQVSRGAFISNHLVPKAADITMAGMSSGDKAAFIDAAIGQSDLKILVETNAAGFEEAHEFAESHPGRVSVKLAKDPHFHVQVSNVVIRPTVLQLPISFDVSWDPNSPSAWIRPLTSWKDYSTGTNDTTFRESNSSGVVREYLLRGSGGETEGQGPQEVYKTFRYQFIDINDEQYIVYVPDPQFSLTVEVNDALSRASSPRLGGLRNLVFGDIASD